MTFKLQKYSSALSNEKGVSLIEGLVATAVLSLGVIAYVSIQGNVITLGDKSEKKSISITLAQDKLESIKNLASKIELPDSDSLTSPVYADSTWSSSLGETVDSEGDVGTADAEYERSWTIAPDSSLSHFYDLSVSVGWTDKSSDPLHTVTLYTQLSQDFRVEAADVEDSDGSDDSDSSDKDKDKDTDSSDKDKDTDSSDKDKDTD